VDLARILFFLALHRQAAAAVELIQRRRLQEVQAGVLVMGRDLQAQPVIPHQLRQLKEIAGVMEPYIQVLLVVAAV
jgi:hypothetical protein